MIAGDFNTWSGARHAQVRDFATRHQLTEVAFGPDRRSRVAGHVLDRIYYRGLELRESRCDETDASDHNPLSATFALPTPD